MASASPRSPAAVATPDIDALINRHKQRLEEHRRYLDGADARGYNSPSLELDTSSWEPGQAPRQQQHSGGDASGAAAGPGADKALTANADFRAGTPSQRSAGGRSHATTAATASSGAPPPQESAPRGLRSAGGSPTGAAPNITFASSKASYYPPSPSFVSEGRVPYAVREFCDATNNDVTFGCGAEAPMNRAFGNEWDKSYAADHNLQPFHARHRRAGSAEDAAVGTLYPLNPQPQPHRGNSVTGTSPTHDSSRRHRVPIPTASPHYPPEGHDSRYFTDSPERMYHRTQMWLQSRRERLASVAAACDAEAMRECSFGPQTLTGAYEQGASRQHLAATLLSSGRRSADGSGGGGGDSAAQMDILSPPAPGTFIDVGEANFLERLQIARARKEEAAARLAPDTTKWQNRVTVPVEFEMGRRQAAIPSLKRPIYPAPQPQPKAQAQAREQQQKPRAKARRPYTAPSLYSSGANTPAAGNSRPTTPRRAEPAPQQPQQGPSQTQPQPAQADIEAMVAAAVAQQVQALQSQLALSQRELAVAKNTIRDLSLGAPAGGAQRV